LIYNEFQKEKTRRKYDTSFKDDVKKMASVGRPISEISNSLRVSASLIHLWYKTIPGIKKKNDGSISSLDINTRVFSVVNYRVFTVASLNFNIYLYPYKN